MSKYIDADELIKWIRETQHQTTKMKNIICKIETMPTIDIVHCRECKHSGICFGRLVQGVEVVQLNFCSYGEREGE